MRGFLVLVAAVCAVAVCLPGEAVAAGRPPVVMIVFDELPGDALLGPDGRIDRGRFPHLAALAGDSTWYPNATTVADWTYRAVPAILDGRWPRKGEGSGPRDHRANIFRLLARHGYRLHSTEELTSICQLRGCRRLRGINDFWEVLGSGRFERLRDTFRSIRRGRAPTFTFHHTLLPHRPWDFLPSGHRHDVEGDAGLTGAPGFADPTLTRYSEQRHLLQLGAVDRAIGELVTQLRRSHLYDRALVVITADHGIAFEPGIVPDRRQVTGPSLDRIAPVPLFIKRPRQSRGVANPAYVRTIDILPTVAGILGIPVSRRVDGRPAWSRSVGRRREVRVVKRTFSGPVKMGVAELERRRRAHSLARLATFGWGSWERVFRIGPHQELLGHTTAEIAIGPPGAVTAQIRGSERYGRVDPDSGFVPSSVVGEIHGGGGAGRDLAVAVNSRIAAVSRSANVNGERFGVMVPESALVRGRNDIEVFEVRAGTGGAWLVPLGRAP